MKKSVLFLFLMMLFCTSSFAEELSVNNIDTQKKPQQIKSFFIFEKFQKPKVTEEELNKEDDSKLKVDENQFIKERALDYSTNQMNSTLPSLY